MFSVSIMNAPHAGVVARRAFAQYLVVMGLGVVLSLVIMITALTNGCHP